MTLSTVTPLSVDRRANPELRILINDMLGRLRDVSRNSGSFTAADAEQAEAELDTIMARVKRAAIERSPD